MAASGLLWKRGSCGGGDDGRRLVADLPWLPSVADQYLETARRDYTVILCAYTFAVYVACLFLRIILTSIYQNLRGSLGHRLRCLVLGPPLAAMAVSPARGGSGWVGWAARVADEDEGERRLRAAAT
jgi:hypothetical protein